MQLMLHCSLLWTSCLRFLTKSPAIPQQLYKTATSSLSAIAELLVLLSIKLIFFVVACRFSVLTVSGTGLNTRRSPSVMRLVSTSWRFPGTAETPGILWRRQAWHNGSPTGDSSRLWTTTTTLGRRTTVLPCSKVAGGTTTVQPLCSTGTPSLFGRRRRFIASGPVACWSNSVKNYTRRYLRRPTSATLHPIQFTPQQRHNITTTSQQL